MHISYFSYFHSKVAVTDVVNHYAYPRSWLHHMSNLLIAVIVTATCSSSMCQGRCFCHGLIFMHRLMISFQVIKSRDAHLKIASLIKIDQSMIRICSYVGIIYFHASNSTCLHYRAARFRLFSNVSHNVSSACMCENLLPNHQKLVSNATDCYGFSERLESLKYTFQQSLLNLSYHFINVVFYVGLVIRNPYSLIWYSIFVYCFLQY